MTTSENLRNTLEQAGFTFVKDYGTAGYLYTKPGSEPLMLNCSRRSGGEWAVFKAVKTQYGSFKNGGFVVM